MSSSSSSSSQTNNSLAEQLQTSGDSIVHLNVGGKIFSTTLATLNSNLLYKSSYYNRNHHPTFVAVGASGISSSLPPSAHFFKLLFCSEFPVQTDEKGRIFVDRDGSHFRYILNYLRSNGNLKEIVLPFDRENELKEIEREAKFYNLVELSYFINHYFINQKKKFDRTKCHYLISFENQDYKIVKSLSKSWITIRCMTPLKYIYEPVVIMSLSSLDDPIQPQSTASNSASIILSGGSDLLSSSLVKKSQSFALYSTPSTPSSSSYNTAKRKSLNIVGKKAPLGSSSPNILGGNNSHSRSSSYGENSTAQGTASSSSSGGNNGSGLTISVPNELTKPKKHVYLQQHYMEHMQSMEHGVDPSMLAPPLSNEKASTLSVPQAVNSSSNTATASVSTGTASMIMNEEQNCINGEDFEEELRLEMHNYYEFQILGNSTYVMIGIMSEFSDIKESGRYIGQMPKEYSFYCFNGNIYAGGKAESYSSKCFVGDRIGIYVTKTSIEFFRNGASIGVAFDDLQFYENERWFVAVSLGEVNAQVKLLSHAKKPLQA